MINSIKKFLKSTSWGMLLYQPLNKVYRLYSVPKRKRKLKKCGYEVLKRVFEISREEKLGIFPIAGTLLGFIREGGFIPWDDDMDFGCINDDTETPYKVADILINKYGFEFVRGFAYQGRVVVYCLSYMGMPMDFYFMTRHNDCLIAVSAFWRKDKGYSHFRQNSVYTTKVPLVDELKTYYVHDIEVDVPVNSEEFLAASYGENWRTPMKVISSVDNGQSSNRELQQGFAYILSYTEFLNKDFGE